MRSSPPVAERKSVATVASKSCTKCGEMKPFSEFWKRSDGRYGLQQRCKTCIRKQVREWGRANPEKKREATRRRYQEDPEREKERSREYRLTYPEKARAWYRVKDALKRGDLTRPSACPECGSAERRIEAHHADYNKPLDVEWLCALCHGKRRVIDV